METNGHWEPPYIQPHRFGAINKFGKRSVKDNVVTEVFGVSINDLVAQYGSPLFVLGEESLRANVRKIKSCFEQRYNLCAHGWSYKTNYISAVCRIMDQEGSLAEVVSNFEYEKARALGVPGARIIFNGPNKSQAILERAIAEGAFIQADHMEELRKIEAIAGKLAKKVKIGIRLNFDTGFTEPWSRFGFNLESGQAHEAVKYISRSQNIILAGLHSHIGTFVLEPRAYAQQVRIMCELMKELEGMENIEIQNLDIGGGFPSKNALQSIYLPPEQAVPKISEYADAICESLLEGCKYRKEMGKDLPRLIYESGRAMIDESEVLISSVVGTKRLPDGRRAAILDAGTNLMFTAFWYNHPVKLTREYFGIEEETVLYGPLCMNIDVVRNSIQLPALNAGDKLLIANVGAYNNTQWLQFIEYRPNVVLISESGESHVIRWAEDLSVMMAQDNVPPHLEAKGKQRKFGNSSLTVLRPAASL
ncbi:MAG: alanine racemase [Candidatus Obscuribacterales bacterium]|nr:alanine racemase [Candidatus Obscuribacterales bacterium]